MIWAVAIWKKYGKIKCTSEHLKCMVVVVQDRPERLFGYEQTAKRIVNIRRIWFAEGSYEDIEQLRMVNINGDSKIWTEQILLKF